MSWKDELESFRKELYGDNPVKEEEEEEEIEVKAVTTSTKDPTPGEDVEDSEEDDVAVSSML